MTDPKVVRVPSVRPPAAAPTTATTHHPAVVAYRKKLVSLEEESRRIEAMDAELADELERLREA